MKYRLTNNSSGDLVLKDENGKIELSDSFKKAGIEIKENKIEVIVEGESGVLIEREGKKARLGNGTKGEIRNGDVIWLLALRNSDDFSSNSVKIDIYEEEKKAEQEIFIKERSFSQEKSNRKVNLILGVVVFLLLSAGTFFGYQKRNNEQQDKKYQEIKSGVEEKIAEAESVRSMNVETALKLVEEAETMINNPGEAQKKYGQELDELKKKISEIKKRLGGGEVEYKVAYDTSLISEGNNLFNNLVEKDGVVYTSSRSLGQISMINLKLQSTEKVLVDEKIKSFLGIFNDGKSWWGYDLNKIYEIKREGLVETELKDISSVGGIAAWNEVIYLVDNEGQNILKLNEGSGKKWLKEGTSLSEEITGIAIDSSIWVLGKSGKIYKYNRGESEDYKMSSLISLSSASVLRTSDKVNFLAYIADENTVVIYGKDGKILGKYLFSGTKINDIEIDESNNGVLVLAEDGNIYEIKDEIF